MIRRASVASGVEHHCRMRRKRIRPTKTCKFKMLKYILLACFAFVSVSRRVTAPNYCNPVWVKFPAVSGANTLVGAPVSGLASSVK